jgi:hypothetical protein
MRLCHFKCIKYANTPSIWSPAPLSVHPRPSSFLLRRHYWTHNATFLEGSIDMLKLLVNPSGTEVCFGHHVKIKMMKILEVYQNPSTWYTLTSWVQYMYIQKLTNSACKARNSHFTLGKCHFITGSHTYLWYIFASWEANNRPLPVKPVPTVPHFKMETMRLAAAAILPGDWAVSQDLRDAYLHVPVHPDLIPALSSILGIISKLFVPKVKWNGTVFPFCLTSKSVPQSETI